MEDNRIIQSINEGFDIRLPHSIRRDELHGELAHHINHLIQHNFPRLVQLLYRIDINEAQLKKLLQQNPEADAGEIIAALIIERQEQKIKTRSSFPSAGDIPDDEKW